MKDHPGDDDADAPCDPVATMEVMQELWDERLLRSWRELKTLLDSVQDVRRAIERNEIVTPAQFRAASCSWEATLEHMNREARHDYEAF